MSFGQLLKQLRNRRGLTQAELARKAEVSVKAVQAWEQQWRLPHVLSIPKLARALGMTPNRLLLRLWHCSTDKRIGKL